MIRLNLPSFDIKVSGSKQHPQILDVLRRKFITLTPEELSLILPKSGCASISFIFSSSTRGILPRCSPTKSS